MPKKAAKTAEPKPWQRAHPGRYQSADGRFAIEQGDPGRWFVVDEESRDEFGLSRTVGPFATLDDAKQQADALREAAPAPSPLAGKLEEAARRPKKPAPPPRRPASVTTAPRAAQPAPEPADETPPGSSREPLREARLEPVGEPAPTWLDAFSPDDASRARRLIAVLEKRGFSDAGEIVRRDFQTDEPAIADALLRRFVRARIDQGLSAALPTGAARALAEPIVTAVTDAVLEAVSDYDRDPDGGDGLPGWQLLERSPSEPDRRARRMHVR